jgi:hypothetical protein
MRKTLKADLSHQLESEATWRPELEPFMRTYARFFFVANVVVLSCSSRSIRRFYRLFFIVPVVDINNYMYA